MNLFEIEKNLNNICNEINKENARHKAEIEKLKKEKNEMVKLKDLNMNGVNIEKYMNASRFIYFEYAEEIGYGDTKSQIAKLKKDLLSGNFKIKTQYYGCKNYAHWTLQAVDCQYGYSPTHGYVTFRISATKDWRSGKIDPNENDLSDIIYVLNLAYDNKLNIEVK